MIEHTRNNNNNNNNADKFKEEFTVIEHTHTQHSRGTSREYSDFFRDHIATTTAYWRRKERLYSFIHSFGLELGLESSC